MRFLALFTVALPISLGLLASASPIPRGGLDMARDFGGAFSVQHETLEGAGAIIDASNPTGVAGAGVLKGGVLGLGSGEGSTAGSITSPIKRDTPSAAALAPLAPYVSQVNSDIGSLKKMLAQHGVSSNMASPHVETLKTNLAKLFDQAKALVSNNASTVKPADVNTLLTPVLADLDPVLAEVLRLFPGVLDLVEEIVALVGGLVDGVLFTVEGLLASLLDGLPVLV